MKYIKLNVKLLFIKHIQGKTCLDRYEAMKLLNVTPMKLKTLRINGDINYYQEAKKSKVYYSTSSVFKYLIQK